MSKYTNVKVNISEGQRKKLTDALENNAEKAGADLAFFQGGGGV